MYNIGGRSERTNLELTYALIDALAQAADTDSLRQRSAVTIAGMPSIAAKSA